MHKSIIVKGAREHNLKNITVEIPRDKFVVVTGLSGSGKSTLAFDTIYAEGQRRYVESLSAYARQFLGLMNKPDVDSIEGLSPAISIEQKTTSKNPRSTVGTVTEVYDYLRLLYARIGTPHCPDCKKPILSQTPQMIAKHIVSTKPSKVTVLSPIVSQKKGTYEKQIAELGEKGFVRVRVNKEFYRSDEKISLDRYKKHDIEAVVDRIEGTDFSRLTEALEKAITLSGGNVIIIADEAEKLYSSKNACATCGFSFEELEPRMFSFNSPFGACEECHGLGFKQEFDPDLIIPDKSKSIIDGAIALYGKMEISWRGQQLQVVGAKFRFDLLTPIKKFSNEQIQVLLYGTPKPIKGFWSNGASMNMDHGWEGLIPQSERLYKQTESEWRKQEFEKFMRYSSCPSCKGKRLKGKILCVLFREHSIIDLTDLSISAALDFFTKLELSKKEEFIARQILKEIRQRLQFLENVGLGYLTISRSAGTLSGGEAQRIRLATQLGSNLMGVIYILDEPSIGLHQRDNQKLIDTLHHLRDLGNTLLVVEHDEDTIRRADFVIDIGPGAGIHGGSVVAQGTPAQIEKNTQSLTGQYLSGKKSIPVPQKRRKCGPSITVKGASENNLQKITVEFPTDVLVAVTGVSGSGKSTLVNETLHPLLLQRLQNSKVDVGANEGITLGREVDKVIVIDQSPIGRTPRSNPATYIKLFDEIRALFAATKEARMRGYQPGRFSFNVKGGRCENCEGDGLIKIEMNFLPDVYIECEECKGTRYNAETLSVHYNGATIADILKMSVEEALPFFENIPSMHKKLETLHDVGLGYIKLGQAATTLSGGEAQRIKITRELAKRDVGHTLYILDEPTTGLHFDDVSRLLLVLNRLVDKHNTVIVIEHNLDVIKSADWIIDLGPEGGSAGGQIIARGTPEDIAKTAKSYTGQFLKKVLSKG